MEVDGSRLMLLFGIMHSGFLTDISAELAQVSSFVVYCCDEVVKGYILRYVERLLNGCSLVCFMQSYCVVYYARAWSRLSCLLRWMIDMTLIHFRASLIKLLGALESWYFSTNVPQWSMLLNSSNVCCRFWRPADQRPEKSSAWTETIWWGDRLLFVF